MVVVSLDPHEARRLGGPKPEREPRPERDRHLPHEVTGDAAADDALDPVDERDRLEPTFEDGEQRPLVARVDRVLARHDAEVRRDPRQPLALDRAETGEDRDADDLVRCDHAVASVSELGSRRESNRRTIPVGWPYDGLGALEAKPRPGRAAPCGRRIKHSAPRVRSPGASRRRCLSRSWDYAVPVKSKSAASV